MKNFIKFLKKTFSSKLDLYFYEELIPNYVYGLLFFTFLLLINQLFYLIKLYTVYNVPLSQIFLLLFNLIPFVLSYTIPLAILPSYLITMGRLSGDSEIVAMKACGISTIRIFLPGFIFGLFIMIFSFLFTDNIVVRANEIYVKLNTKIISQKPAIELKEKAFLQIGDYKISFERVSYENNLEILHNISVVDLRGRKTIQAEMGRIYLNPENPEHYILKFMNGSITEVTTTENITEKKGEKEEKFFVASFKNLTLNVYMPLPEEYYSKGPDMMKVKELKEELKKRSQSVTERIENYIKDKEKIANEIENFKKQHKIEIKGLSKEVVKEKLKEYEAKLKDYKKELNTIQRQIENYKKSLPRYQLMKYYEKFALPLASLSFVILSLSIGMYTARSGRNEGLGIGIILTLLFYGLKVGTENLITNGFLPPITEWFATILFLISGIILAIFKIRE
ncbi:MAG: LptF/LptG family permease [Brevinematales bacterium]|nr:LptF/LptG family permease [Brevinematales bacterium]